MAKKKQQKQKPLSADEPEVPVAEAGPAATEPADGTEEEESVVEPATPVAEEPTKVEVVESEADKPKKGKKAKEKEDPFDAFVAAAEIRWPGSIKKASELPVDGTPTMSTGNFGLDLATYGGLRRGRLYRFWGRPKSAKTGSALNCAESFTNNHCADCFEHRLVCKCDNEEFRYAKVLYVDVEGRVADNRPWAEMHGIDPTRIAFVSPKGGEQVVDIADAALRSDVGIGLVIIDSIAQMSAQAEVTKAAEKGMTIGRNAMLVNSALRKWVCSIVSKDITSAKKPTIILINQIRNKTEAMGNPDVMPGGLGQEYASACDIKFTRRQKHFMVPDGKGGFEDKVQSFGDTGYRPPPDASPDYIEVEYKVTESGICPPGRYGLFNYWLKAGHGRRVGDPDNATKLWDYAKSYGIMERLEKGGYRLCGLESRTQKELEAQFAEQPEIQEQVWAMLLEKLKYM